MREKGFRWMGSRERAAKAQELREEKEEEETEKI